MTSPLYPDQYPLNSHCTWTTKPLPGNKTASVYVTINKVDLRDDNNVKVINKGKPLSYYTGSELLPDTVARITDNVTASIVFDSSIMNNGTGLETPGYGFSLSYRFLGNYNDKNWKVYQWINILIMNRYYSLFITTQ